MTVFDKLRSVTKVAQREQDLPDYLSDQIFRIIEHQEDFRSLETEIDSLAENVTLYDTYGQTGYLGMGVNSVILEMKLIRLEEKRKQTSRQS